MYDSQIKLMLFGLKKKFEEDNISFVSSLSNDVFVFTINELSIQSKFIDILQYAEQDDSFPDHSTRRCHDVRACHLCIQYINFAFRILHQFFLVG